MKNQAQLTYGYYNFSEACREDGSDQPMEGWDGDGYYVCDGATLTSYDSEEEAKVAVEAAAK